MRMGEEKDDLDDVKDAISLRELGSNDGGISFKQPLKMNARVEEDFYVVTNSEKENAG
jgi:hypothetical protein